MSAHRRRKSLRACSAHQCARGRHKWTRGATESSHAKFHMIWPLGVLNRGTERRGSDEERTPSSSNRARRRTKLEVHGDARTRPKSARLRKRKETPSRIVLGPLLSPFKAPSGVRARDGRELSDTERAAFAKCMHFATRCGQASVADVCKEWGISKSHGYRILNRWRTEESVQSRPRSGRPRALTQEDMKMLESLSEEVKGYFTWESKIGKSLTMRTRNFYLLLTLSLDGACFM